LAALVYGIKRRKGFVVTTGEVGTGKTLLIQCLMQWLSKTQIAFSHIFNPRLSVFEFLQYFITDLGLTAGKTKGEMLIQLNQYLIGRYRKGSTTVLIMDEGQLLDWEVLEEIRLLTNLETVQEKLLQIILIGQPELEVKLDSVNLRQLKQRIAFRCHLEPLSEEQVRTYISRRLEVAGAPSRLDVLFPNATVARITHYSKGIPRLINTICEYALIAGYARQIQTITPEIIDQVAADARLGQPTAPESVEPSYDRAAMLKELFQMNQTAETEAGEKKQQTSLEKERRVQA
jgi:type II secretory pathway predicted ATPase ExeA